MNKKRRALCLRAVAGVLVWTFVMSDFSLAAQEILPLSSRPSRLAMGSIQSLSGLEVPSEFCTLKEYHAGRKDQPVILHIQDAHANYSGQKNLAATLDFLMEKYGISLVLTEGSAIDSTLTPLREMIPKGERTRFAKSLLMEGEIAGEEYLNLTSEHDMKILGVEDEALYFESLHGYSELAQKREPTLTYLKKIQSAIDTLKKKHYPKVLLDYEKSGLGRQEGAFSPERLLDLFEKSGQGLQNYPSLSQMKTLLSKKKEVELAGVASELSNLDLGAVLAESRQAEDEIYKKLLEGTEEKRDNLLLRAMDRYFKLLETAYTIQMTSGDFKTFLLNEPDYSTVACLGFLNRKLCEEGLFAGTLPLENVLEQGKKSLTRFYESVDLRDEAFIQNAKKILDSGSEKTVVLIAGGYHTEHLKELFEREGYGYAVLSPVITGETNQAKYEKLLLSPIQKSVKVVEVGGSRARFSESQSADGVRMLSAAARLAMMEATGGRLSAGNLPERIESAVGREEAMALGARFAGREKNPPAVDAAPDLKSLKTRMTLIIDPSAQSSNAMRANQGKDAKEAQEVLFDAVNRGVRVIRWSAFGKIELSKADFPGEAVLIVDFRSIVEDDKHKVQIQDDDRTNTWTRIKHFKNGEKKSSTLVQFRTAMTEGIGKEVKKIPDTVIILTGDLLMNSSLGEMFEATGLGGPYFVLSASGLWDQLASEHRNKFKILFGDDHPALIVSGQSAGTRNGTEAMAKKLKIPLIYSVGIKKPKEMAGAIKSVFVGDQKVVRPPSRDGREYRRHADEERRLRELSRRAENVYKQAIQEGCSPEEAAARKNAFIQNANENRARWSSLKVQREKDQAGKTRLTEKDLVSLLSDLLLPETGEDGRLNFSNAVSDFYSVLMEMSIFLHNQQKPAEQVPAEQVPAEKETAKKDITFNQIKKLEELSSMNLMRFKLAVRRLLEMGLIESVNKKRSKKIEDEVFQLTGIAFGQNENGSRGEIIGLDEFQRIFSNTGVSVMDFIWMTELGDESKQVLDIKRDEVRIRRLFEALTRMDVSDQGVVSSRNRVGRGLLQVESGATHTGHGVKRYKFGGGVTRKDIAKIDFGSIAEGGNGFPDGRSPIPESNMHWDNGRHPTHGPGDGARMAGSGAGLTDFSGRRHDSQQPAGTSDLLQFQATFDSGDQLGLPTSSELLGFSSDGVTDGVGQTSSGVFAYQLLAGLLGGVVGSPDGTFRMQISSSSPQGLDQTLSGSIADDASVFFVNGSRVFSGLPLGSPEIGLVGLGFDEQGKMEDLFQLARIQPAQSTRKRISHSYGFHTSKDTIGNLPSQPARADADAQGSLAAARMAGESVLSYLYRTWMWPDSVNKIRPLSWLSGTVASKFSNALISTSAYAGWILNNTTLKEGSLAYRISKSLSRVMMSLFSDLARRIFSWSGVVGRTLSIEWPEWLKERVNFSGIFSSIRNSINFFTGIVRTGDVLDFLRIQPQSEGPPVHGQPSTGGSSPGQQSLQVSGLPLKALAPGTPVSDAPGNRASHGRSGDQNLHIFPKLDRASIVPPTSGEYNTRNGAIPTTSLAEAGFLAAARMAGTVPTAQSTIDLAGLAELAKKLTSIYRGLEAVDAKSNKSMIGRLLRWIFFRSEKKDWIEDRQSVEKEYDQGFSQLVSEGKGMRVLQLNMQIPSTNEEFSTFKSSGTYTRLDQTVREIQAMNLQPSIITLNEVAEITVKVGGVAQTYNTATYLAEKLGYHVLPNMHYRDSHGPDYFMEGSAILVKKNDTTSSSVSFEALSEKKGGVLGRNGFFSLMGIRLSDGTYILTTRLSTHPTKDRQRRNEQQGKILEFIASLDTSSSVILAGDFNFEPDEEPLIMNHTGSRWADVFSVMNPDVQGLTYSKSRNPELTPFDGEKCPDRVFYLSLQDDGERPASGWTPLHSRVVFDEQGGGDFVSDHFGVVADLFRSKGQDAGTSAPVTAQAARMAGEALIVTQLNNVAHSLFKGKGTPIDPKTLKERSAGVLVLGETNQYFPPTVERGDVLPISDGLMAQAGKVASESDKIIPLFPSYTGYPSVGALVAFMKAGEKNPQKISAFGTVDPKGQLRVFEVGETGDSSRFFEKEIQKPLSHKVLGKIFPDIKNVLDVSNIVQPLKRYPWKESEAHDWMAKLKEILPDYFEQETVQKIEYYLDKQFGSKVLEFQKLQLDRGGLEITLKASKAGSGEAGRYVKAQVRIENAYKEMDNYFLPTVLRATHFASEMGGMAHVDRVFTPVSVQGLTTLLGSYPAPAPVRTSSPYDQEIINKHYVKALEAEKLKKEDEAAFKEFANSFFVEFRKKNNGKKPGYTEMMVEWDRRKDSILFEAEISSIREQLNQATIENLGEARSLFEEIENELKRKWTSQQEEDLVAEKNALAQKLIKEAVQGVGQAHDQSPLTVDGVDEALQISQTVATLVNDHGDSELLAELNQASVNLAGELTSQIVGALALASSEKDAVFQVAQAAEDRLTAIDSSFFWNSIQPLRDSVNATRVRIANERLRRMIDQVGSVASQETYTVEKVGAVLRASAEVAFSVVEMEGFDGDLLKELHKAVLELAESLALQIASAVESAGSAEDPSFQEIDKAIAMLEGIDRGFFSGSIGLLEEAKRAAREKLAKSTGGQIAEILRLRRDALKQRLAEEVKSNPGISKLLADFFLNGENYKEFLGLKENRALKEFLTAVSQGMPINKIKIEKYFSSKKAIPQHGDSSDLVRIAGVLVDLITSTAKPSGARLVTTTVEGQVRFSEQFGTPFLRVIEDPEVVLSPEARQGLIDLIRLHEYLQKNRLPVNRVFPMESVGLKANLMGRIKVREGLYSFALIARDGKAVLAWIPISEDIVNEALNSSLETMAWPTPNTAKIFYSDAIAESDQILTSLEIAKKLSRLQRVLDLKAPFMVKKPLQLLLVVDDTNRAAAETVLKSLETLKSFLPITATLARIQDGRLIAEGSLMEEADVLVFADGADGDVLKAVATQGYGLVSSPRIEIDSSDPNRFSAPDYAAMAVFRYLFSSVDPQDVRAFIESQRDLVNGLFSLIFKEQVSLDDQIMIVEHAIGYSGSLETLEQDLLFFARNRLPLLTRLTQALFSSLTRSLVQAIQASA